MNININSSKTDIYIFFPALKNVTFFILQIFPMNVKVSAGTLVTLANWSFGWIVAFAYNFMLEWNASGINTYYYIIYYRVIKLSKKN